MTATMMIIKPAPISKTENNKSLTGDITTFVVLQLIQKECNEYIVQQLADDSKIPLTHCVMTHWLTHHSFSKP